MGQSNTRPSSRDRILRTQGPFWVILAFLSFTWFFLRWQWSKEDLHLYLNGLTSSTWDGVFLLLTRLGEGWIFGLAAIAFLFHDYRKASISALAGLAVLFISAALKNLVFAEALRPSAVFSPNELRLVPGLELHKTRSFPSGHTMAAFGSFFLLALCYPKKWWSFLMGVLALLTGISRVYLSQHFLEDVVAGAWLGTLITWGVWKWGQAWSSSKWDKSLWSLWGKK